MSRNPEIRDHRIPKTTCLGPDSRLQAKGPEVAHPLVSLSMVSMR